MRFKGATFKAKKTQFNSVEISCAQDAFFNRSEFHSALSDFNNIQIAPGTNASFAGVKFGVLVQGEKTCKLTFESANFGRASLKGADFRYGADLTDADLSETRHLEWALYTLDDDVERKEKSSASKDAGRCCSGYCFEKCAKKDKVAPARTVQKYGSKLLGSQTDGYEDIRAKFPCGLGGMFRFAKAVQFRDEVLEHHAGDITTVLNIFSTLQMFQLNESNW